MLKLSAEAADPIMASTNGWWFNMGGVLLLGYARESVSVITDPLVPTTYENDKFQALD